MPIVVEREPDLVVQDASASNTKAKAGEKVTISATVANTGPSASHLRIVLRGLTGTKFDDVGLFEQ
jgi:subtilase family serine protease